MPDPTRLQGASGTVAHRALPETQKKDAKPPLERTTPQLADLPKEASGSSTRIGSRAVSVVDPSVRSGPTPPPMLSAIRRMNPAERAAHNQSRPQVAVSPKTDQPPSPAASRQVGQPLLATSAAGKLSTSIANRATALSLTDLAGHVAEVATSQTASTAELKDLGQKLAERLTGTLATKDTTYSSNQTSRTVEALLEPITGKTQPGEVSGLDTVMHALIETLKNGGGKELLKSVSGEVRKKADQAWLSGNSALQESLNELLSKLPGGRMAAPPLLSGRKKDAPSVLSTPAQSSPVARRASPGTPTAALEFNLSRQTRMTHSACAERLSELASGIEKSEVDRLAHLLAKRIIDNSSSPESLKTSTRAVAAEVLRAIADDDASDDTRNKLGSVLQTLKKALSERPFTQHAVPVIVTAFEDALEGTDRTAREKLRAQREAVEVVPDLPAHAFDEAVRPGDGAAPAGGAVLPEQRDRQALGAMARKVSTLIQNSQVSPTKAVVLMILNAKLLGTGKGVLAALSNMLSTRIGTDAAMRQTCIQYVTESGEHLGEPALTIMLSALRTPQANAGAAARPQADAKPDTKPDKKPEAKGDAKVPRFEPPSEEQRELMRAFDHAAVNKLSRRQKLYARMADKPGIIDARLAADLVGRLSGRVGAETVASEMLPYFHSLELAPDVRGVAVSKLLDSMPTPLQKDQAAALARGIESSWKPGDGSVRITANLVATHIRATHTPEQAEALKAIMLGGIRRPHVKQLVRNAFDQLPEAPRGAGEAR